MSISTAAHSAAKVHTTEQQLRTLLDASGDAFVAVDMTGRIHLVNRATERVFGYTASELVGQPVSLLMSDQDRVRSRGDVSYFVERALDAGRRDGTIAIMGRAKDGTMRPMNLSASMFELGGQTLFVGVLRDLRARVELRARNRSYEALLANVRGMVYRCAPDRDWLPEFVSDGSVRLTGYAPELLMGCGPPTYRGLVHDADREVVLEDRTHDLRTHGRSSNEYRIVTAAGDEKWVWDQASLIRDADGRPIAIEGLVSDVTEQRELGRLLARQQSLAKLGELAAVVAHEIRNPLAGIVGAAQVLRNKLRETEVDGAILDAIIARTQRLDATLSDLLNYARPRTPARMPVPVRALVEAVLTSVADDPAFEAVAFVTSGGDIEVDCDRAMIERALLNIVVNAAQAMVGRGHVWISWRVDAGGDCVIAVLDEGPGMPAQDLSEATEPFFTTKPGGSGLGLAVAHRTLELHHGTLTLDLPPAGGTRVQLTLPMR